MNKRTALKIALGLVLVLIVAGIYVSPLRQELTRENVRAVVAGLRGLWYGPIVFMLLYALGCVLVLPASIFVIASGFIWGWAAGGTWAILGGMLGATISFFLGRFLGEGILEKFGSLGRMVLKQADHAGFRSLLFLRFIPGIPFAVLNYGAGVAGVRLGDFALSTLIGMAPSVYVFAYCADALFNGTMSEGDVARRVVTVCLLMIALALIPVLVKRFAGTRPEATTGDVS